MIGLRDIFAKNVKENRKKCGFSQAKLAEMAEISTHYIAMIELAHNFPSSEIIERLASVLNVEIYELFVVTHAPKEKFDTLRQLFITDIRQMIEEAVETAFAKRDTKPRK